MFLCAGPVLDRSASCSSYYVYYSGGNGALQWSMITDANNYGEWKTRRRITGMNVAANIFVIKLGVAVGGAILGWVLAAFDYTSGSTVQSASAVQGAALLIYR